MPSDAVAAALREALIYYHERVALLGDERERAVAQFLSLSNLVTSSQTGRLWN
jgi:hypothetical protein